ncbi:MAG TPA: hypothetical protein VEG30_15230 [Terriglobales bacterium]|nr:hypothetical protein [Terriglobales bacterium]HXZ81280.1 hypothetical protein [Terriglobales bacterium]
MKSKLLAIFCVLLLSPPAIVAGSKKAEQVVDSGTFGIFVAGRRVATEKFQISQSPEESLASSELRLEDGSKNGQRAEMKLSPSGDLVRYKWSEFGSSSAQAVVEPQNEFLVEHIAATETQKAAERSFLLPTSTLILEDYFFSHRQILLWRYLAAQCRASQSQQGCAMTRTQFGVLVPRQQNSEMVSIEFVGKESTPVRGAQRELNRFNLQVEGVEWALWVDDQYKVQRILVASEKVEVIRE